MSHNRRRFMASTAVASAVVASEFASSTSSLQAATPVPDTAPAFRYCLNTSTINGSKVPVRKQLKVAADAGYDSVELWLRDIAKYVEEGGTHSDLAKEISDLGLEVDSAIAFGNWIVDDDKKRKSGLEQCKRDMEIVAKLGGKRIAAPPAGATREAGLDLREAAIRYHDLLEAGKDSGVVAQVELWGFSANLSKLEEVLFVAAGAQHPDACVLLDVYHMYKGGSDFENIGLVPGAKMHCLHMNDYPADPPRDKIGDADRVYPGDGVAPMNKILRSLAEGGFDGSLSLELFNREYWKQPAEEIAKVGIEKMKECVAKAFPA